MVMQFPLSVPFDVILVCFFSKRCTVLGSSPVGTSVQDCPVDLIAVVFNVQQCPQSLVCSDSQVASIFSRPPSSNCKTIYAKELSPASSS